MEPGARNHGPASLQLVRMTGLEDKALLEVKSVHTPKDSRNQGQATALMAEVCAEADKDHVLLILTPDRFDTGPLDNGQLEAWYAQMGFVAIQGKPVLMCRDPRVG